VNDGVDVAKRRDEVVAHDIGADPGGARNGQLRQAPGDADDLLDRRVGAERAQHARPGVAGGADDGDAHQAGSGREDSKAFGRTRRMGAVNAQFRRSSPTGGRGASEG